MKTAIIEMLRSTPASSQDAGVFEYFDKLPVKKRSSLKGVRVVPGAVLRYGCFIEDGAIVMPGFVNVGAYVGSGTMVDTWATVGSCAQIGRNVHLSGGVGIGGVLEPAQAAPVIIEDGAFIGSRYIVVEGIANRQRGRPRRGRRTDREHQNHRCARQSGRRDQGSDSRAGRRHSWNRTEEVSCR